MLSLIIVLCILNVFCSVHTVLQSSPVTFQLFTRSNPNNYTICRINEVANCSIDPSLVCKFLIHGYSGSPTSIWIPPAKDEYLKKGSYNIFVVDWESLAKTAYPLAVYYTKQVGNDTGQFIYQLHSIKGVSYDNIHIIGHSLGAHAGGFAGKRIKVIANNLIKRITGLDPAGPPFNYFTTSERLFLEDADKIDIIHTDANGAGSPLQDMGKINFYPNKGERLQPGCLTKRKRQADPYPKPADALCSHTRACLFFYESINSLDFVATQCVSWYNFTSGDCDGNPTTPMGENFYPTYTGLFFLKTNAQSPFAQG